MAPPSIRLWSHRVVVFVGRLPGQCRVLLRQLCTRRGLLILTGLFVVLYALAVLLYVQSVSNLGLRTAFSPFLKAAPTRDRYHPEGRETPRAGDRVVQVGYL